MSRRILIWTGVALVVMGTVVALRFMTQDSSATALTEAVKSPPPSAPAAVPEYPRVSDAAGILPPFNARLARDADAFYEDLGIDVHIVTLSDNAPNIEAQSNQIFEQRKIGAGAPTGGLLIILNPKLASARIEVGYTLEGALTDLHMGRIARDQLAPYTSYGASGMAVMDVLHYLRDHVYLSAALGNLELSEAFRGTPAFREYQRFLSSGAGAKTALSAVPMDADLKRTVPKDKRARYAPSAQIEESVEAFLRATVELAGDPTLELFTEGSQLMRTYYPFARFEELQRFERIQASRPLEISQQGDYAVATSKTPAEGFVPVLLHKEQELWRIDLVETWKNLFFDGDGNHYLRNSNTPYAFGLKQFGRGRYHDIASYGMERGSLHKALELLKDEKDALPALYRAEIWLRNAFVFPQAYASYQAARRAAPNDPFVLQTIGDRALYLGFPEIAIPVLEKIGRGYELVLAEAYNETGDLKGATRWVDHALKENPYDLQAHQWQKYIAEREGRTEDVQTIEATIASLTQDEQATARPVALYFHPQMPQFDPDSTLDVNGTKVFDHSKFSVTMRNESARDVEVDSVLLTSMGTSSASGLGDVKKYWQYPAGGTRLRAGERIWFEKQWGFTVDTGHQHVRYVFRTCWHGVGTQVKQCRTQWVDTMP